MKDQFIPDSARDTFVPDLAPAPGAGPISVPGVLQPEPTPTMTAPVETPAQAVTNAVGAFGTQAASAGMLGYDDEVAGLIGAMAGGSYAGSRDKYKSGREALNALSPTAGQLGRVTGTVATALLPASSALRAGQVAKSALVGGVAALGHSEADLTKGEYGQAAKDVAIGTAGGALMGKVGEDLSRVAGTYSGARAAAPVVSRETSVAGPRIVGEKAGPGYRPASSLPQGNVRIVPDGSDPETALAAQLRGSLRPTTAPAAAPDAPIDITGRMIPPGYRPELPSVRAAAKGATKMGPVGTVASYLGGGPVVGAAKLPVAALRTTSAVGQNALATVLRLAGEGKRTGPWIQEAIDAGVPERTVRGIISYYTAQEKPQ